MKSEDATPHMLCASRRAAIARLCGAFLVASLGLEPVAAEAHAYDLGPLHIDHPWARPTPNGAPTAAGYLSVTNHGRTADRLLGASSPAAGAVEPHTMSMSGGMMRMRLLPGGYEIAPGATLTLAPMGDHLMFAGLKRPFRLGERIPATLRFARAGEVEVEFVIQAQAPATGQAMRHMEMK